jgi:LPXTG-site transpeptidase (sortase) family protein
MTRKPAPTVLYLYPHYERVRQWLQTPLEGTEPANAGCSHPRRASRLAEACLWVVASCGIAGSLFTYTSAYLHQKTQTRRLNEMNAASGGSSSSYGKLTNVRSADTAALPQADGLLGAIEIPRLGISSVVEEGVDDGTLAQAVGHIPGTRLPGQDGNTGLAAHRDTYFRRLGEIQPGDEIIFRAPGFKYLYKVESTQIVNPSDTQVLSDEDGATLTLITCFPFYYIGPAPKRFVVTARAEAITGSDRASAAPL